MNERLERMTEIINKRPVKETKLKARPLREKMLSRLKLFSIGAAFLTFGGIFFYKVPEMVDQIKSQDTADAAGAQDSNQEEFDLDNFIIIDYMDIFPPRFFPGKR